MDLNTRLVGDGKVAAKKPGAQRPPLWVTDLAKRGYREVWTFQHRLAEARMRKRIPDILLLVEHDPVFTMGRHGNWENLLLDKEGLEALGIECVPVERGGDITYHGPGQLVGYPIVQVPGQGRRVRAFVGGLERVMLSTLAKFGIQGALDPSRPGVWVAEAKVGAVGIAVRGGIALHGFSLNVNLDLTPFSWIRPCGTRPGAVTSMRVLLGKPVPMDKVKETVVSRFLQEMGFRHERHDLTELSSSIRPNQDRQPSERSAHGATEGSDSCRADEQACPVSDPFP